VKYAEQAYQDLIGFATRRIVPQHVWEEQDVRTWRGIVAALIRPRKPGPDTDREACHDSS